MAQVIVAGVGMIPFARPGTSGSYDLMGAAAARLALADAGIEYSQIQRAIAGYVHADSCAGQAALYHVGLTGIPIANVSNNCSSGSSAFALCVDAVAGGAVDCALALGFEQMLPGALETLFSDRPSPVARHAAAASEYCQFDAVEADAPVALRFFAAQTDYVVDELGLPEAALARIAVKARRHASKNPLAIHRSPVTESDVLDSPRLLRRLRKLFACPPSCGAAAAIVCSDRFARRHGISRAVRLAGRGWASDAPGAFATHAAAVALSSISSSAADAAYAEAGVAPGDVDVVELHDCFVSNEAVSYVALGLASPGDLARFVAEDSNTFGGQVVVNPSGGLLSKGHPLGATGLAQITELTWHLRGTAGDRQVPGARIGLQHNVGLGSAAFVHVLKRHEH